MSINITILSKENDFFSHELMLSARKYGYAANVLQFESFDKINHLELVGDVVIWKDVSIKKYKEKKVLFDELKNRGKYVFDLEQYNCPYFDSAKAQKLRINKYTEHFEESKSIHGGASSRQNSQLNFSSSVDREFINQMSKHDSIVRKTCYFSIICIAGNVFSVYQKNDDKTYQLCQLSREDLCDLSGVASRIQSIFNTPHCEIILLFDQKKQSLEFHSIRRISYDNNLVNVENNVLSDEIIKQSSSLCNRKKSNVLTDLVKQYYNENLNLLPCHYFHYVSRSYLWFRDAKNAELVMNSRDWFIGNSKEKTTSIIKKTFNEEKENVTLVEGEIRRNYILKYPKIRSYNRVLFLYLFTKSIYNQDIFDICKDIVSVEDMILLKESLENDPEAMAVLSTLAVNFLYLLEFFLKGHQTKEYFLDIPAYFDVAVHQFTTNDLVKHKFVLQIYYFTHCIINESRFYSQPIQRHETIYLKMLKFVEHIIHDHYFNINLDNKFEFLVCCRLLSHSSHLEKIIYSEAEKSLSNVGNYLVDTHNAYAKKGVSFSSIDKAEHRNVLFLMAFGNSPYSKQ